MTQQLELRAVDPTPVSGVQLPRSEFRRIVEALVDGVVIIDRRGIIQRANRAIEEILGYTEEELLGKNVSVLMAGEDRERHDDYLARYHESGRAQVIGVGREVDGRHKDGTLIPVGLAVTPAELNGRPMYVGLLRDITERREYEERYRLNERIMRAVNQALGNVINEGLSTREMFDAALTDLLDVTGSEYGFIGEILHRNDLPKGHLPLRAYLGLPIYSGSKLLGMAGVANRKGGYTETLTEEIKPFINALGTLIAAHQNTASRIKAEETLFRTQQQLKEMATSDPVTGISNRYMVVQQLEMLFERTGRGENLAVLFLDVDHFKAVNDSHGHDVGDEVLKHIAAQISESLRPTDTVGRYGGEEFLIGLPECSVQDAQMIAERMRLKIAQSPFELPDGQRLSLSVSIGVAGSPHGWEDLSELIREGDQSMYAAKRAGRNCVVGG